MNLRPLVPFAALSLAAGVLAGCSAPSDNPSAPARLTIAELLGQQSLTDNEYKANEQRVQELVADCMAEQGWEYIPVTPPDYNYVYDESDELERIQREGYGIAYWTLNQGNDVIPIDDPGSDWVDPNTAYVDSLTDSERGAYNTALYGDALLYSSVKSAIAPSPVIVDPGSVGPSPTMAWGRGCFGEASDEVYGVPPTYDEAYYATMNRFYEELNVRVLADTRIKALEKTWAACMREAGYAYDKPEDVWTIGMTDFQTRHDEIVGDLFSRDPFAGWTQQEIEDFYQTATQEQIDAMYADLYVLTDAQRMQLEALLADEIAMAVPEYQCSKAYNTGYQEAYAEIEEEYAIEHQAEIEALVASQEG